MAELAAIGIGSNLEQPNVQIDNALSALTQLPDTALVKTSPRYRSAPMGPSDQPDYVNAVAILDTGLEPEILLDRLQTIETAQGRVRNRRWGARTLDLDVLVFGDREIVTERLVVPHPGIRERAFVLVPLFDVLPALSIPGIGPIEALVTPGLRAQLEPLG